MDATQPCGEVDGHQPGFPFLFVQDLDAYMAVIFRKSAGDGTGDGAGAEKINGFICLYGNGTVFFVEKFHAGIGKFLRMGQDDGPLPLLLFVGRGKGYALHGFHFRYVAVVPKKGRK